MNARALALSCSFALALVGCGGGGGVTPSASSPAGGAPQTTTVTLRIDAPPASQSSARRKPAYISPATQSLVYDITYGGSGVTGGNSYVNLTTASTYCSTTGALQPLTCTTTIPITISTTGTYTFNVATYDAQQTTACVPGATGAGQCAGNELSNQELAQTLTAGANNTVSVVLGGVATSVSVTPQTPGYLRGDASALKLWGKNAENVLVVPRDADGNAIVGLGAPSVALTSNNASLLAVTAAGAGTPNLFTLQSSLSDSSAVGSASMTAALTAPSSTSGSVPADLTVPITLLHSIVFFSAGSGVVSEFYDGSTTATQTIDLTPDVPQGVAVDGYGTLYVADNSASIVFVYPAGSTNASEQISIDVNAPEGLAVDSKGTLYVANYGGDYVAIFPNGSSSPSSTLIETGIADPYGAAVDGNGTLYIANTLSTNPTVTTYKSGATTPGVTLPFASPLGVAVDSSETLYVVSSVEIAEYAAGFTAASSPTTTISGAFEGGVAVDAAGTIYVATANGISEYAAGSTSSSSPVATIAVANANNTDFIAVVPASMQP